MRNSTLKFCAMLLAICTSAIPLQAMDEWDGVTIAKGFYSGTGTKADPYRIFTASQFLYFIQQTKDGNTFSDQYVELCNDIAFNHEPVEGGDFYGDFDGNDHTIQADKYWSETGWTLFDLYGSMHDVQFVRANAVMHIYTGGILYNCRFEFPSSSYHGYWTVYLNGGTIANCVSNSAHYKNGSKYGGSYGLVYGNVSSSHCSNCYFPITSCPYGGNTPAPNYYGVIESCGEEAGNDWVLNHTEHAYKSWPLTFSPTYPEYQIQEQPKSYNPSVVCPNSDKALFQWHYQERKPITFEDIPSSSSTQTKNIVVLDDDAVLSFYFEAHGYRTGRYNDNYHYARISVNGEEIVHVYDERAGTYSCQASAGSYEISCELTDISNIRITYPVDTLANETSSVLSKQTIMEKPGAYFCQVSYGEGCDVMNSDYVDYEKLLTIDNVTYVINEDATATVLWIADMAVDITIPETVYYDDVNYPVTSISSKAFVDCTSLVSIKCKTSAAPALLGGTAFEGTIPSNVTLYVPIDSESAYSSAEGWKEFGTFEVIIPEKYNLIYVIDQTEYKKYEIEYGEAIIAEEFPTKEGYTFSGWSEIPETMPAHDVVIEGLFTVNRYRLTYMLDGEEYSVDSIAYGTELVQKEALTKEGHTFSGWSEIPATMPANDVTVEGSFAVNTYTITYMVDGVEYKKVELEYGTTITAEAEPTKEGYTFSGWSEIPATMPANDVTVEGSFAVNTYTITYMVDGTEYKKVELEYGTTITAEAEPTKEGYTFSGWIEIPATMPANDVTVEGSFAVNTYTITYMIDGTEYKKVELEYGTTITAEAEPTKEGYTFSGWSGEPETMPAQDVTVEGTFTVNRYKVTYMVDGEEYASDSIAYGEVIVLRNMPVKDGYIFSGWSEVSETMPAQDVTVTGFFTVDGIDAVACDKFVDVYTLQGVMVKQQVAVDEVKNELPKGFYIVNGKKMVIR